MSKTGIYEFKLLNYMALLNKYTMHSLTEN